MSARRTRTLARAFVRVLLRALLRTLCVALVLAVFPAVDASAASCPPRSTSFAGVVFGHLPSGLGRRSDFRYHFAGVHFVAAVWERGPNPGGGYRESLDAVVMHGPRLVGPHALHEWYLHYQQRPARDCRYRPLRIHGHFGWTCRDQVFWLMRPGLAVSVQLDRRWWGHAAVVRLARATHQRRAPSTQPEQGRYASAAAVDSTQYSAILPPTVRSTSLPDSRISPSAVLLRPIQRPAT